MGIARGAEQSQAFSEFEPIRCDARPKPLCYFEVKRSAKMSQPPSTSEGVMGLRGLFSLSLAIQ